MDVRKASDQLQSRYLHQYLRSVQNYLIARTNHREPSFEEAVCWSEFFTRFDPIVRGSVRKSLPPGIELEDAVQDAWLEIIQALPRLDWQRESEHHWLYGWVQVVVRRRIAKFWRQSERVDQQIQLGAQADPGIVCSEPLDNLCRHEERQRVQELLLQLQERVSPTSYQIICMRWLDGAPMALIAERTNLTPEQVRVRHHRAKHQLAELMRLAASSEQFVHRDAEHALTLKDC